MGSKYPALWFQGLNEKDKKSLIATLDNSDLPKILQSILEKWRRENVMTKPQYENPSWAYLQAHQNGMTEILDRLDRLFAFDQKEK
ncbi:MAG: hypothetical protein AB7W16_15525 [Candidatus Obscuribacterales bacterium]